MKIDSKLKKSEYCLIIGDCKFIYNLDKKNQVHDILHLLHSLISTNAEHSKVITVQLPAYHSNIYSLLLIKINNNRYGIIKKKNRDGTSTEYTLSNDDLNYLYSVLLYDYNNLIKKEGK